MDALDLLSDDEDNAGASGEEACGPDAPPAKQPRLLAPGASRGVPLEDEALAEAPQGAVSFNDLQHAGYKPVELLEADGYLRDAAGQELRRPKPPSTQPASAPSEDEDDGREEAGCEPPPAPPPTVQVRGPGDVPPPWTGFGGPNVPRAEEEEEETGTGSGAPEALPAGAGLPPEVRGPLLTAGFEHPTPIQAHALPVLLQGRDLIGVAQTGSGKTLAYLLPCLALLLRQAREDAPRLDGTWSPPALVVAPTRELVCQIEKEAQRFQRSVGFEVAAVYGGAPRQPQLAALRGRPGLVAATPGRLSDFLREEQTPVSVTHVRLLVLDEADRMLDDGFEPQIRELTRWASRPDRQTAMFSATWPQGVQQLAADFLRDPVEIRVGSCDALRANPDISQDVSFCEEHEKSRLLLSFLRSRPRARTLVFVATKRACRELSRSIRGSVPGRCDAIHGDRSQDEREAALAAFRSGEVRVLFATDVAGRGLDIPGVVLVINFDPPRSAEDYVHRIGRTGRAGEKGLAVSLLTWRDADAARSILDVMRRTGVPVPPELVRRVGPELVPDRPDASRTAVMCFPSSLP